jgi:hypothetical protein
MKVEELAYDYCAKMGWYLVAIPAGTKGPTSFGWQKPEKCLSDPASARAYFESNPTFNVGLLHSASGTVSLDIDNVENTKVIFKELGLDYDKIMALAPRIVGRADRAKAIFKAPHNNLTTRKISWPVDGDPRRTEVVFELRAGSVQDVLPPSIHPDTGQPYTWSGPSIWDDGLPELPHELVVLWEQWDKFRPQLQDMCPWKPAKEFQPPRKVRPKGDGTSVIDAFNEASNMDELLQRFGYRPTSRGRYLSPNSSSGLAGVILFDDGRAYSHHASDPFDSAHSFDAFELWCQYEHMGDTTKAVREASILLNVTSDPEHEYDAEAIEHGKSVANSILPSRKVKQDRGPLESIPEHLLSVPGVLNDVVNYYETTTIKTQPQFAVQTALALGSVAMGRRFTTTQRNFTSLYFLNIGDTGCGKEHAKTVLEAILDHAGLGYLVGPSGYTSSSGLFSAMLAQPTHVAVIDELGRNLKSASNKNNQHKADSITSIMEVFGRQDGTLRPQGFSKMGMSKQQADEFDKVVKRPSLTLVGMSTPEEFYAAIGGGDVASGLLNRFVIIKSEIGVQMSKEKRHMEPGERIVNWVRDCANASSGEGNLTAMDSHDMPPDPIVVPFSPEAWSVLRVFEEELVSKIKSESGSGLAAMYNRSREIVMRLSLIVARSMGQSEISLEAMNWSIDYVRFYAGRTIAMFKANMSDGPFEAACKSVYAKIEEAGLKGITAAELSDAVRVFANLDKRRRQDVLDVLAEDKGIECRNLNEGKRGRPRFAWFVPAPES